MMSDRRGSLGGRCLPGLAAAVVLVQIGLVGPPGRAAGATTAEPQRSYPSHLYVERDVWLTPQTYGLIEAVLVDVGDHVLHGQPLLVVESDLASGEFKVAEQQHRLARAEYDRVRALRQRNEASAQDVKVAEARAELARTTAGLAQARLERCTVRAPFRGTIVDRSAVVGQRILEDEPRALLRLVADGPLTARVLLPESQIGDLRASSRAWIDAAAAGTMSHPARVVSIGPTVDPDSGTTPVIVELESEQRELRVGASVTVRFADASE